MAGPIFDDGVPWDHETDEDRVPWDHETDEVPPEQAPPPHFGYLGVGTVDSPCRLILLDGHVFAIEQQYLP